MSSIVRINWQRKFDNKQLWSDVFIWTEERFGLPSSRYCVHANVEYMEYVFNDAKDALIMSLMWNAPIITEQELAIEFEESKL